VLANPYYIGTVRYGGVENPNGRHEPLIDKTTFDRVQRVLDAHAMACERDRKHHHYLKGSLRCDLCRERVTFVKGRSKTGRVYDYFACLGRIKGTGCKLPYFPAHKIEDQVPGQYAAVKVVQLGSRATAEDWHLHLEDVREALNKALAGLDKENAEAVHRLRARLEVLDGESKKLLQAFYADALSADLMKAEQDRIKDEKARVQSELDQVEADISRLARAFKRALDAAQNMTETYREADGTERRNWNQALFLSFRVRLDGTIEAELREEVQLLTAADTPRRLRAEARKRVSLGRGSNKTLLAEGVGFEPTRRLTTPNGFQGRRMRPRFGLFKPLPARMGQPIGQPRQRGATEIRARCEMVPIGERLCDYGRQGEHRHGFRSLTECP
jgi:site-specific DNA recombinase